jgi:tetratricopeptide (TPR) repeat protein
MDRPSFEDAVLLGPAGAALAEELDGAVAGGDARALLRRAELRTLRRQYKEAIDDVLAAGRELAEDRERGPVSELLAARLLQRTLRKEAAEQVRAHARVPAERGGPRARLALAMAEAEMHLDALDLARARAGFAKAIELADAPPLVHERLTALVALATIAQIAGDFQGAVAPLDVAASIARAHQDAPALADACFALGNLYARQGDLPAARAAMEEALAAGGLAPPFLPAARSLAARLALKSGDAESAARHAVEGAKAAAAVGSAAGYADGTIVAATALAQAGKVDVARRSLIAGERVLRERGEVKYAELVAAELRLLSTV